MYPWSKSGPHVTAAIQTMLTQAGIRTMRNMYDVTTQWKEVTWGHERSKWLTSFSSVHRCQRLVAKLTLIIHNAAEGGVETLQVRPVSTLYRTEYKELYIFFFNLGFQFKGEHRIVQVSRQNWRMSTMGRWTVANSRIVLCRLAAIGLLWRAARNPRRY